MTGCQYPKPSQPSLAIFGWVGLIPAELWDSESIHFLRFPQNAPIWAARREATSEGFRRALVWHLGRSRSRSRGWVTWGPANNLRSFLVYRSKGLEVVLGAPEFWDIPWYSYVGLLRQKQHHSTRIHVVSGMPWQGIYPLFTAGYETESAKDSTQLLLAIGAFCLQCWSKSRRTKESLDPPHSQ